MGRAGGLAQPQGPQEGKRDPLSEIASDTPIVRILSVTITKVVYLPPLLLRKGVSN